MASAAKFRQLKVLKSVADCGSMTRAAQSLGISQPAVSRVISDLTELFGFSLFDRKDGLLIPSKETRYILPDISRVIELMDHIQYTSKDLTARRAGHLRVACLPGFATSHLPNVVASFLEKRPDVTITIEPDRPERILEWIIGEQYDCGITMRLPATRPLKASLWTFVRSAFFRYPIGSRSSPQLRPKNLIMSD